MEVLSIVVLMETITSAFMGICKDSDITSLIWLRMLPGEDISPLPLKEKNTK